MGGLDLRWAMSLRVRAPPSTPESLGTRLRHVLKVGMQSGQPGASSEEQQLPVTKIDFFHKSKKVHSIDNEKDPALLKEINNAIEACLSVLENPNRAEELEVERERLNGGLSSPSTEIAEKTVQCNYVVECTKTYQMGGPIGHEINRMVSYYSASDGMFIYGTLSYEDGYDSDATVANLYAFRPRSPY